MTADGLNALLEISHATADDIPRARRFYTERNYGGGIQPEDLVLVAEYQGQVVGIVRLAPEQGTTVLRGMQVDPAFQRQGVGMRLLAAVAQVLGNQRCFCIPYTHLADFYGKIDFVLIDPAEAPAFLRSRLAGYQQRGDGKEYVLMCRDGMAGR